MNVHLNMTSFFSKYIAAPLSDELSKGEKATAVILTATLTFLTLGMIFIVYYCLKDRKITQNPSGDDIRKVDDYFHKKKDISLQKSAEISKANIIKAQAFLDEISEKHRSMYQTEIPLLWRTIFLTLEEEFAAGPISKVRPEDHKLSNLILDCQEDEEAYFIPANSLAAASSTFAYALDPSHPAQLEFLKRTLHAAFLSGKKIVVVRLGNDIHAVAAGFMSNGNFKIIDSMSTGTVNIQTLTQSLNQASIKNNEGESISFQGEYVNTHLQRGGHECIRFATLYCYYMYKQKSLEAFKEVNGAFFEGKLQCFEDYKKIKGSTKIYSINNDKVDYADFMRSWTYRMQGLTIDKWEDIPFKMIKQEEDGGVMQAFCLQKGVLPKTIYIPSALILVDDQMSERIVYNLDAMPKDQEIFLEDENDILGSLSLPSEKRLIICEEDNPKPRLYRLLAGQKLYTIDWLGKRQKKL